MKNIKILTYDWNVTPILDQINANPEDWQMVANMAADDASKYGGDLNPPGFLPLTMGVVSSQIEDIKNSEKMKLTPLYQKYSEVMRFWYQWGFEQHSRAAFFRLKPGGKVGTHIDEGTYYLKKDRYHLALQGVYKYHVGNEELIVKPGMFFWFDNKLSHGTEVISEDDRITLVFDAPHSPNNPQHRFV